MGRKWDAVKVSAKLWRSIGRASLPTHRPWQEVEGLNPRKYANPSRQYQSALAEWRKLCCATGHAKINKTNVLPSATEHARRFAIETGEIEKLYKLTDDAKQRAIGEGFDNLHEGDQKPSPGVPWLETAQLIGIIRDQERGLTLAIEAGKQGLALTEERAKQWHTRVTAHQPMGRSLLLPFLPWPPMARGWYKPMSNNVLTNEGNIIKRCPVLKTRQAMDALFQHAEHHLEGETNTLVCATWVHYAWLSIHPFIDGNGRTGRLAMAHAFARRGEHPPVITADDTETYFEAVKESEKGNPEALRKFIEEVGTQTLKIACTTIAAQNRRPPIRQ